MQIAFMTLCSDSPKQLNWKAKKKTTEQKKWE